MAGHVPREHTFTVIMIDIQGYVFPLITMSLRGQLVCTLYILHLVFLSCPDHCMTMTSTRDICISSHNIHLP